MREQTRLPAGAAMARAVTWLLALPALGGLAAEPPVATFHTEGAAFGVDAKGSLCLLARTADGRNYLATNQPAPLLSVRVEGKWQAPDHVVWGSRAERLALQFSAAGVTVVVGAQAKPAYVRFEVLDVQPADRVELVLWGPYPTTIRDIVGEVVGVVRDGQFAIGIQALNAKTLGGYPTHENDIEAESSADDPGHYPGLPPELNQGQSFRGDTARLTEFGSVLQAYCRDRSHDRILANWGHDKYLAPAFPDGGVVGSKIALFACPAGKALDTIGAIELAEGLPHPLLDGVWAKTATNANCSYLIVDFSETTIDRAIEMTRRAGLSYLYHSSAFATWGHFKLKPDLFPHGWDGLRGCVEKARQAGVRVGFHTLSNFITPNDPYVTPAPDPRLARIGVSALTANVDAVQKEIPVAAPDFFIKKTDLNTVVVGDELVRYGSVSAAAPWRLLDCQRGAWGTHPAAHARGDKVGKLMDHGYKVLLPNAELTQEIARNIAKVCNTAGTRQISLDGLEGNWSTGMGQYGRALFTQAWYDALAPELRGTINDASNPGHFNWHVYTRMNWGEPWYAGFRESQTLYRFKNQLHFERNLMPHMLGWFALRPDTSLEDAEWLLARAAGFDAGFALAAGLASTAQLEADPQAVDAAKRFGAIPAILDAIKRWEALRLARVFPPAVKARLRDNAREFHLAAAKPGGWDLFEVPSARLSHDAGQPAADEAPFSNPDPEQPLQWIIHAVSKQPVTGLTVEINGKPVVDLHDLAVPPGGNLKYAGGPDAAIYDSAWKEVARVAVSAEAARVGPGPQKVKVGCAAQSGATLKIELRTLGAATHLGNAR